MADNSLITRIVLRNDVTANWEKSTVVLKKGEAAVDTEALIFKIGDGVHTWGEIEKSFKSYQEVINEVNEKLSGLHTTETYEAEVAKGGDHLAALGEVVAEPVKGDIGIVKEAISGDKKQYTAYVYDGAAWKAMDGNYNAENVYFDADLTYTANIGVKTVPSSGSGTISAAGKNVKQVFADILAKEANPSTTQPTATLNSTNIGAKEVGTNIAVAYSFSTNAGSYTYGPATGVTFSGYEATFNGETLTGATGTFKSVQVTDTTNLTITGKCSSTGGAIPKTNIGNNYAAGQIKAKSYTPSKGTLTGYRGWFYGYYNGTQALGNAASITSDQLRAFGVKTSFPTQMTTNQMQQMFFAAPKGRKSSLSISNAVNGAPLTVTKASVMVEGANKYEAVEYDLFYVANAVAEGGESKWNIK